MASSILGRETSLARLDAARRDVDAHHVVLVEGVAGIGKTTLLRAFWSAAGAEGDLVGWGAADGWDGAPALWPWFEALSDLDPEQSVIAAGSDGADAVSIGTTDMAEMFRSVARWLTDLGRRHRVAIVVEDVHAADPTAQALLQYLARRPSIPGVTIVASARPGDPTIDAIRCLRIPLAGLAADDVSTLARSLGRPMTDAAAAQLTRRTSGNPLFVQRLVEHDGAGAALPSDIVALLRSDVAAVDDDARRLLDALSVLGTTSLDVLSRVVPRVAAEVALSGRAAAVVEIDDGMVAFRHALFRKVVHDDLDPSTRFALHAQAAGVLRAEGASTLVLAHHLSRAAASHRGVDAARAAREAARIERASGAIREANRNLSLAVAITRELDAPAELGDVLVEAAEALGASGSAAEAEARLIEAAEVLDPGDRERCRRLVRTYCRLRWLEEPNPSVLRPERLLELAERLLDVDASAADAAVAATAQATAGDIRGLGFDDLEAADRAVAAAERSGELDLLGEARLARRRALSVHPLRFDERRSEAERAYEIAVQLDDHEFEVRARRMALTDALAAADRERAVALLTGEPRSAASRVQQALALATMRALEGRYEAADDVLDDTIKELSYLDIEAPALDFVRISHAWDLGQLAPSIAEYESLLPVIADPALRGAVALSKAMSGNVDVAAVLVDETLDTIRSGVPTVLWQVSMAMVAETAAAIDHPAAGEIYDMLVPFAGQCVVASTSAAPWAGAFDRTLGLLSLRLGRIDDAIDHLHASITVHDRMGARPWAARSHAALAAAYAQRGDAAAATEHETAAARLVDDTGMSADVLVIGEFATGGDRSVRPVSRDAVLRRNGATWTVGFGGETGSVAHTNGLVYLERLVARAETDWHAIDLYASAGTGVVVLEGSTGPVLDDAARDAYRARYAELQLAIDEAEANADLAAAERARDEADALERSLVEAFGLNDRPRVHGDPAEKARINVRRSISRAIARIADVSPVLARHLDRSIRTGRFCRYEPETLVDWTTSSS